MIEDKYQIEFDADFKAFGFDSEGPKGRIRKVIQYSEINLKNYYNLGFGDKNMETNLIDDLIITDNRQSENTYDNCFYTFYIH